MSGVGFGAGFMYVFDPDRGKRRRALILDQAVHAANTTSEAMRVVSRDASNRTRGVVASMQSWLSRGSVSDEVLEERIRSRLGMVARHPGSIEVSVKDGQVTLRGPVLADEVDYLLRRVSRVSGVTNVLSQLDVHQEAGDVPGLQGGPSEPRRGEQFELMQVSWSPTVRFLMGMAGGALAIYGAAERTLYGATLTAVGLALLSRGLTNWELSRLIGVSSGGAWKLWGRGRPDGREQGKQDRRLKEIMTHQVEVIPPDASLEKAAERMKTHDVGAIPVCENDHLVGMVTDRDIVVRIVADGGDPKVAKVRDAMTPDIEYCFEDDSVQEVARKMAETGIRRLVVLNRQERLVGIVSLGNLAVHARDPRLTNEVLECLYDLRNHQHKLR